jgi:hypothetical protein
VHTHLLAIHAHRLQIEYFLFSKAAPPNIRQNVTILNAAPITCPSGLPQPPSPAGKTQKHRDTKDEEENADTRVTTEGVDLN